MYCQEQPSNMLTMAIPYTAIQSVCSMILIYSPDGTNVCGSRGGQFKGIGSVQGFESCQIVFLGGTSCSLVQTLLL